MLSNLAIAVRRLMTAAVDGKRQPADLAPNNTRLGNVRPTQDKPEPFSSGTVRACSLLRGCSRIRSLMWLALVAAVGVSVRSHLNWRGAEADPAPASQDFGYPLTRGPFEVVIASSGVIQPSEVVDVGAQVSGQLSSLWVKLGDRVETGQLVAEID